MIASSVSGQRRLAKKLNVFLTSSCDVILNLELELELVAILQRLGLDWKLDRKATANFADVMPVGALIRVSDSSELGIKQSKALALRDFS